MLPEERKVNFLFGTGGAGFCLSRPLVERMEEQVSNFAMTACWCDSWMHSRGAHSDGDTLLTHGVSQEGRQGQ